MRHVCFLVDDIDAWRERLGGSARFEDHGNAHSLYLHDPDGHAIELTTYEV
jgi:catechol 2,3-dioxygenase-like lactoylglutathione lyase family enzyme